MEAGSEHEAQPDLVSQPHHRPVRARLGVALYLGKGATGVGQKRFAEFSVWAVATWIVSSHAHTPFTP